MRSFCLRQDLVTEDFTEKALNLDQWFDAGLHMGAVLKPKKLPPAGYEVAAWSEDVPFLKHLRTGVVLWPIRFNLMPFFEALEGQMAYRRLALALDASPHEMHFNMQSASRWLDCHAL